MRNIGVKNRFEKVFESYIFGHSFTMFIFVGKNKQNDYDVLYANLLAMEYFSQEVNQSASCFLGDFWKPIKREVAQLSMDSACKTDIKVSRDTNSLLFELDLQQQTDELGDDFICIGLRERTDFSENRESLTMLEHKYTSINEKLQFLSYHDQLTGLWNRQAMNEHFNEDANFALKNNEHLSIVHVGIDRFKLINEALGQNGGDEILKMVAERLKMICPTSTRLYRNSSDEFIVSMKNHSVSTTENFAQKILNDFGKPFYYNHQEYFISASIGISVYPEDGRTLESLLRKSEQALTYVKDRGRAQYRFYRVEMNSVFPDEVLMESHLRRAVELEELAIHYQPQVDLKTGHIGSFEALLRWNNRKFGFVSPAHFIPIAEESGLIHGIGDWVLEQVCSQLKEWQDKGFKPVRIAVNISPKQFRMENFVDKLKKKIKRYGIVPASLEVEITESALTNMNETLAILNELKKIGIFISVDDFGTGYSSLSYLKQYPIDIIKIDRSFIKDIETDPKNEAIAKTIINLAHNLGMEVIAEGVEKDLQADILLGANCQKAQGFLYSKAIPVGELVEKYFVYSK